MKSNTPTRYLSFLAAAVLFMLSCSLFSVTTDPANAAATDLAGTMTAEADIQGRVQSTVDAQGNRITGEVVSTPALETGLLLEDFSSSEGFTQTDPHVYISDGSVVWNISRDGGDQFVYRDIPAFEGDVKLTVVGQIDQATSNCNCGVGIGDAVGQGPAIAFGFYGGGCSTSGMLIFTRGVTLAITEDPACSFNGPWPWIDAGRPYTAALTITGSRAHLEVSGVAEADGKVDYAGGYTKLWIGYKGDGDWPSCSGKIESVLIEPLH